VRGYFLPELTRCAALSPPVPACPSLSQPVPSLRGCQVGRWQSSAPWPRSPGRPWACAASALESAVVLAPLLDCARLAYVHPGRLREQSPGPWAGTPYAYAGVFSSREGARLRCCCSLVNQSSTPRRPRIVIRNSGPRTASSLGALPIVLLIDSTPNLPPSTCPSNSPQSMELPSKQIPRMPSPDLY
jgi:hypothetical protein